MKAAITMAVLALALVGCFGSLPGHEASAAECFDRITGAGWISAPDTNGISWI